jgi:hypothetical protein
MHFPRKGCFVHIFPQPESGFLSEVSIADSFAVLAYSPIHASLSQLESFQWIYSLWKLFSPVSSRDLLTRFQSFTPLALSRDLLTHFFSIPIRVPVGVSDPQWVYYSYGLSFFSDVFSSLWTHIPTEFVCFAYIHLHHEVSQGPKFVSLLLFKPILSRRDEDFNLHFSG